MPINRRYLEDVRPIFYTSGWTPTYNFSDDVGRDFAFKNGGGIHIKPENRGKFTATMQRTGKTAEQLSHSSNPLTRKRAIFALNARKWHH